MKFLTLGALHTVLEGTLCLSETYTELRLFSGLGFKAYLRKTAEEIIDRVVRVVIECDCVNELMGEAPFVIVTVNVKFCCSIRK